MPHHEFMHESREKNGLIKDHFSLHYNFIVGWYNKGVFVPMGDFFTKGHKQKKVSNRVFNCHATLFLTLFYSTSLCFTTYQCANTSVPSPLFIPQPHHHRILVSIYLNSLNLNSYYIAYLNKRNFYWWMHYQNRDL